MEGGGDHAALVDQPRAVRPGEEIDASALDGYLSRALPELTGALTVEQFPRGFSNLTYLVVKGGRELVLRRPPPGAAIKSAHDMGREHRILSALAPVYVKSPRPLSYCEDPSVLGAPFYLMERVRGVILRGGTAAEALAADERRAISEALVDALAELHALDHRRPGLAELGHGEGYVERQVKGWTARYQAARTGDVPAMEQVAPWLAAHQPPAGDLALIHNDFKHDNVVLDPARVDRVVAVLDWEMATVGDPLMDLGTTLAYWVDPDDPPALRAAGFVDVTSQPGSLRRREVAGRYARATGRDLARLPFYYAFGLFKVAVIAQQIYARFVQGHTRDPRFARLDAAVAACASAAARVAETGRIDELGT
jgi:aminoglycoside phosphotransferase (APT) family kinase protein